MQSSQSSPPASPGFERRLADHPWFGDSSAILERRLALYELALEVLAGQLPSAREAITRILALPRERRTRALDDPIARVHVHEALKRLQGGALGSPDHLEVMLNTLDPTAWDDDRTILEREMIEPVTLGDGELWVWTFRKGMDESAIVTNFKRRFSYEFLEHHARTRSSREGELLPPTADSLQLLRAGYDLVRELAPTLAPSVLAHVRLVAWMRVQTPDAAVQSGSIRAIPSSIFFSPRHLRTPWAVAEALMHEAAHNKLFDLYLVRLVLKPGYDCRHARKIPVPWKRPTMMQRNEWPVDQALSAFHVYMHLAVLGRAVDGRAPELVGRFGATDESGAMKSSVAVERAEYLGEALLEHGKEDLGPDGLAMVQWLWEELRGMSPLIARPSRTGLASKERLPAEQTNGSQFERAPGLRTKPAGDDLLVFTPARPGLHWLNASARAVLEQADGRDADEIVRALALADGDGHPEILAAHVRKALSQLEKAQAVQRVPEHREEEVVHVR